MLQLVRQLTNAGITPSSVGIASCGKTQLAFESVICFCVAPLGLFYEVSLLCVIMQKGRPVLQLLYQLTNHS